MFMLAPFTQPSERSGITVPSALLSIQSIRRDGSERGSSVCDEVSVSVTPRRRVFSALHKAVRQLARRLVVALDPISPASHPFQPSGKLQECLRRHYYGAAK